MSAHSSLPTDDFELELEEVEPLTSSGRANGSKGGGSGDPPGRKQALPVVRTASFGNNVRRPSGTANGGAPGDSGSSGRKTRARLFALLFLLLGVAVLLVVKGEEEVEQDIETGMDPLHGRARPPSVPSEAASPHEQQNDQKDQDQPKTEDKSAGAKEDGKAAEQPKDDEGKEPAEKEQPKDEAKPAETPNPADEPKSEPAETPKSAEGTKDDEPKTDEEKHKAMVEKWGEWHFWDGDPDIRPKNDYAADFPNRDITEDKFPTDSWQVDAVYANHFLNDASNIVSRAQEAIYTEYGWGKPLPPEKLMARSKITQVHRIDLGTGEKPPGQYMDNGGWTTKRSFDGLVRRLLHAVFTNDSFTVVIVGDGAAGSGRGNHFLQTYGMQFQQIMEPIFNRLNVKFETRHMVREESGGPLEAGLGFASIFGGGDVDLVVWDSSGSPGDDDKTKKDREMGMDLLARQALISGGRVPFLLDAGGFSFDVLKDLHEKADVDVGGLGMGWSGISLTESDDAAKELPWAVRYLKCPEKKEDLCEKAENKYLNTCWIDRDDVKPPTKQNEHVDGQGKSHPGWRYHQLKGRLLAFTVLDAMQEGFNTWSDVTITGGHPLPDEYWHVTDHYQTIRDKVLKLDAGVGSCHNVKEFVPERICSTPLKGRTESTPRAYPEETSIVSMVKPAAGGYVPKVESEMLYSGPDKANPLLEVPEDSIDVRAILSAGIRRRLGEEIVPGMGWEVQGELPGSCNGTATGICGRRKASPCLLAGHMDSRGGLLGNEYSGWLVMNIKDMKEGIIILELETSHGPDENERTKGWTEAKTTDTKVGGAKGEKKEGGAQDDKKDADAKDDKKDADTEDDKKGGAKENSDRMLRMGGKGVQSMHTNFVEPSQKDSARRKLLPDTFKFDYAIDGKIRTLDKKEFEAKRKKPRENLELLTVLDDAKVSGGEDVELAIRMTGCGRDCTFSLTHVYWA